MDKIIYRAKMDEITYLIYDCGFMVAGFAALDVAVEFVESRSDWIEADLVDAKTGEVIDTYVNGTWENGDY